MEKTVTIATIVRYQTSPEAAEENVRLIRAVFAELHESNPDNIRYMTFRLEDGVSFVHVAMVDQQDNPLSASPAFAEFQSDLKNRVVVPPAPAGAQLVASYGFDASE
jgi:hypothetical protein